MILIVSVFVSLEGGGIVFSVCVGNEFLVGSTYVAHQSLWRNDSHCVCLCWFRGRGLQYGILRVVG